MSMINEFVKELREKSALFSRSDFVFAIIAKDYKEAADTIEELSAKLASANMERSEQYYKGNSEFVEKLRERLGEYEYSHLVEHDTEECLHCRENEDDWCNCRNCFICVWDKAKAIVKELAEEYKDVPDTNAGKWIPVSEALPDDFMSYEYLTIRKGQTLATITYYCVVNHKWYSNRKSTKEIDVIAWQPLPQLCKGE